MTLVTLEVAAWWSLHDLRIALTLISLRDHSQVWKISPLHNQARHYRHYHAHDHQHHHHHFHYSYQSSKPTVRSGRSPLCITQARQYHHQPSTSVLFPSFLHMNINLSLYFQHQVWQTSSLLNHVLHVDVTEKLKSSLSTNSKSIWYWISSKLADSLIASLMVFQITHEIKFNLTCE